jgi:hypothetical protein
MSMMTMINAQVETLSSVQKDNCIQLEQSYCNSTFQNISKIVYPNKTTIYPDLEMQKVGCHFNYTFCNTSSIGWYEVSTTGDVDGEIVTVSYNFEVTYSGSQLSTGQSIIYVVILSMSFLIFFLLLYASLKIPFKNPRNEEGKIINVNNYKFLKIGAIIFSYFSLMFIFGIVQSIANNYLYISGLNNFFEWLYWIMLTMAYPLIVLSIVLGFIVFINDYALKKKIKRHNWR